MSTLAELQAEVDRYLPLYNEAARRFNEGDRTAEVKNDIDLYGGRVVDARRAIEVKMHGLPRPRSILDFFKYGRIYRRR